MQSPDHVKQNRRSVADTDKPLFYRPPLKGPPRPMFRSNAARDMASILDLNPGVQSWTCSAIALRVGRRQHVSDFQMEDADGRQWLLDVFDRRNPPDECILQAAASVLSFQYRRVDRAEIYDGFRLRNANDLLRYAGRSVPLGDRVCLLSLLGEHGPLSLSDCLRAVRETRPVAAIASLILQGYLEVDLDDELIGPETMVRRISG
jgi:hypothetical protein